MTRIKSLFIISIVFILFGISCNKTERDTVSLSTEIDDFIWKGMNSYYLWQDEIPVLSDERFSTQSELNSYLEDYPNPDEFFDGLKYEPETVDKWSWITSDYLALEAYFSGLRKTTGAKFLLYYKNTDASSNQIFGLVKYVLPDSDADAKGIERGDVFDTVNGSILTDDNYIDLLFSANSFELSLGTFSLNSDNNAVITPTGETVNLVTAEYPENPVYKQSIFEVDGQKIGYLMYNSFTTDYDTDLNDAFGDFQNEGIDKLILDLRYNGGGSVRTAIYLCSMITGQYTGEVLSQEIWNDKNQTYIEENQPESLINTFVSEMNDGTPLNQLNLNSLYVLTTDDTASASELVINALNPYIDVYTIGSTTVGKYVASTTLYDSPNFSRTNTNPDHSWAIQPIILKEVNRDGGYAESGFNPVVPFIEYPGNMGTLGEITEPFTAATVEYILYGTTKNAGITYKNKSLPHPAKFEQEMYVEKELLHKLFSHKF